ncbi:acetylglutamate kinase [Clostridium oceanicum]|uniref:Acetylglutamate kinase n=1 Tax=Clostridium oceanicum TaxID=1543 RepID=A0ABP3UQS3_9CLOT
MSIEYLSKNSLKKFKNKLLVVKFGGSLLKNKKNKESFLQDIAYLKNKGINLILVHGGGPLISSSLNNLNIKTKFINGLRFTDEKTIEVAEMVLSGKINKNLTSSLCNLNVKAIGISGTDCNLIKAKKKYTFNSNQKINLGFVGEVEKINTDILKELVNLEYVPVISPIGCDAKGQHYNINADYAASAISSSLKADKLIFATDVDGIYLDIKDKKSIIKSITVDEINTYIEKNIISGGMIPKIKCCIKSLKYGTKNVSLINGTEEHSLLKNILENKSYTTILKN